LIPLPVVPLKGITVLVTRPADQTDSLCGRIEALGGTAIRFPAIAIEPVAAMPSSQQYDWVIFISANAVRYGLKYVSRGARTRIAAIGKATAAVLVANNVPIDVVPSQASTSESLLAHPELANIATQSVLIVKGLGGRELLQDALSQRAAQIATLDVYRRVLPPLDPTASEQLEQLWVDAPIDVVTITSVETLDNLFALITEKCRALLASTAFVTVSERIAAAARVRELKGPCLLSRNADDDSIVGAIAAWHARAR
jgi:uroporphyrinogen-III synthase